ncbi:MAG: hypothetical protein C0504_11595 [Candidatus Solibacter sp.]|nr:hypothetical protein [Candidatus Solibacter sp.]
MRGSIWAIIAFAATAATPAVFAQARPGFSIDVEPLLKRRCVMCHNARLKSNGLRFDDPAAALEGGYSGPVIVPGNSAASKLIHRVTSDKDGVRMPPAGPALSAAEIATLKSWIDSGADWPRTSAAKPAASKQTLWSFQPITQPDPPTPKNAAWTRNPIDNFILARLEKESIAPSPEAPKTTLIRRLAFDLTGLPPTPAEVAAFLADSSPDAYDRLVDRLLASPHYGEQRARAWLDQARYGDSDGLEKDRTRPWHWRWRDWVINAYNTGMPFDRFTVEQLAGDLLDHPRPDQLIATGFHRNTLTNREGGADPEESRFEQLVNRTNTTSTVWLGLTVGCAQCHDHKFDPISQKDYYALYAFFNNSSERDIDAPLPGETGPWMRARPAYLAERARLMDLYAVPRLQLEWEASVLQAMNNPGADLDWDFIVANSRPMFDRFEEVISTPSASRSASDRERLMYWFISNTGPDKNRNQEALAGLRDFRKRLAELDAKQPRLAQAPIMVESPHPPKTRLAVRGDFRAKGIEVLPAALASLPPLPEGAPRNRLTFARWLVSNDNPLTARVTVNRLWQEMFGRGLVLTSEDFGTQGAPPTHPELLDWLASNFRDNGWSVKQTLRLIVTSATYRQSSNSRPGLLEKDPENTLLARQSRIRLQAEQIRDAALSAAGLLNDAIGGPSVRPPQPKGIAELGYAGSVKWNDDEGPSRYRRGLYIHFQRTTPYPMLMNFDAPDSNVACSRRRRSNSPLQALNLLNDPVFFEAAQALALRLSHQPDSARRFDDAFLLALGRTPSAAERARLAALLDSSATALSANAQAAADLLPVNPNEAAWVNVARVLLNLDEFITRE